MGLSKNKPIIQEEPQMVKKQKKDNTKKPISKEDYKMPEESRKISASMHYEACSICGQTPAAAFFLTHKMLFPIVTLSKLKFF